MKKYKKTFEIVSPVPRYSPFHKSWAKRWFWVLVSFVFVMLIGYNIDDFLVLSALPNLAGHGEIYSLNSIDIEQIERDLPALNTNLSAVHLQAQKHDLGRRITYIPELYFCSTAYSYRNWAVRLAGERRNIKLVTLHRIPPTKYSSGQGGDILAGAFIDLPSALSIMQTQRNQHLGKAYERWPSEILLTHTEDDKLVWIATYRKIFKPKEVAKIYLNAAIGE